MMEGTSLHYCTEFIYFLSIIASHLSHGLYSTSFTRSHLPWMPAFEGRMSTCLLGAAYERAAFARLMIIVSPFSLSP
jgi:hypothetical protein